MPPDASRQVAVLFARDDSYYHTLSAVDVYTASRDARSFLGGAPVVAHPPCRAWGRLRALARPRHDEKDLARWAVSQIRREGGVLEHPAASTLWYDQRLPPPGGLPDEYGGYSIVIDQCDFGHPARKRTWLYIVGVPLHLLPDWDIGEGVPVAVIGRKGGSSGLREASRFWREATPPLLADWLVRVARSSSV